MNSLRKSFHAVTLPASSGLAMPKNAFADRAHLLPLSGTVSINYWLIFLVLTFAGSSLGGLCRFVLSGMIARRFGERFPLGTMVVNISGAFLIGMVWVMLSPGAIRDFLMFGFLGGYTTVSSFTLNTLKLLQDRQWLHAALNLFGSFLLCLAAVFAGAGIGALFVTS